MARYNFTDYLGQAPSETEALQMIFNEIGNDRTPTIDLNGEVVNLTSTVYYFPKQNSQRYVLKNGRIHGNSNDFDLIAPDPELKNKSIAYGSDDDNIIKYLCKFDVDNVVFRKGRNQLVLVAQRGSRITNCAFELGVRGVLAVFVQHGIIDNCQFQFHDVEAVALRTGVSDGTLMEKWFVEADENNNAWFTNPTTSNSQCNRFTVRNTWVFCKPDQRAGFRMQGSDGVTFENCVTEGENPWYSYYLDSRNSTTVDTVNIIAPHIEHGAEKVLIFAREMKNLYISRMRSQIPENRVIEVEGNIGQVVLDNLCFLPFDNDSFKSDNQIKWIFREPVQDIQNVTWSRWVTEGAGEIPKEIYYQRGVDLYALGTQGISLRSDTFINGRRQRCFIMLHGHTLTKRAINYEQVPSQRSVQKKGNLNDW